MRILFLHGDHTTRSKDDLEKLVAQAKSRNFFVVRLNSESNISLSESISGASLFESKQAYIIDDEKLITAKNLKWLAQNEGKFNVSVAIRYPRRAPPSLVKELPKNAKISEYKVPVYIFKFLESLYPGNQKEALNLFSAVLETETVEFVFTMMARHFRDLYWVLVDPASNGYPMWRKSRLAKQAGKLGVGKLTAIIEDMASMDLDSKTGGPPLGSLLDVAIMGWLQ